MTVLRRDKESWQRDPRAGVLVIVGGVALAAFVALAIALFLAPAFIRFDVAVSAAISGIESPVLVQAAKVASWLGSTGPMVVLTLVVAAAFAASGRRTSAVMFIVAVAGGAAIGNLLKAVFERSRPTVEALIAVPGSYSFPSGHAVTSFLFFGTLAFFAVLHRTSMKRALLYVALCVFAAVAIALSRVYLGVHYLGDIIGAWLLGSAWLALVVLVFARWGTGDAEETATSPGAAGG